MTVLPEILLKLLRIPGLLACGPYLSAQSLFSVVQEFSGFAFRKPLRKRATQILQFPPKWGRSYPPVPDACKLLMLPSRHCKGYDLRQRFVLPSSIYAGKSSERVHPGQGDKVLTLHERNRPIGTDCRLTP